MLRRPCVERTAPCPTRRVARPGQGDDRALERRAPGALSLARQSGALGPTARGGKRNAASLALSWAVTLAILGTACASRLAPAPPLAPELPPGERATASPPAAPAAPPPTRAGCELLVDRLAKLLPGEQHADRETEISSCLDLPGPLFACLEGAEGQLQANGCVDDYLGPPSAEDCRQTVAHLRTLDPTFAEDADDEAVDHCVSRMTRLQLSCIRDAGTMEEARRCEQDPPRP